MVFSDVWYLQTGVHWCKKYKCWGCFTLINGLLWAHTTFLLHSNATDIKLKTEINILPCTRPETDSNFAEVIAQNARKAKCFLLKIKGKKWGSCCRIPLRMLILKCLRPLAISKCSFGQFYWQHLHLQDIIQLRCM